jgi:hypothetical protein
MFNIINIPQAAMEHCKNEPGCRDISRLRPALEFLCRPFYNKEEKIKSDIIYVYLYGVTSYFGMRR